MKNKVIYSVAGLFLAMVFVLLTGLFVFKTPAYASSDDEPFMIFDDYDTAIGSAQRDSAINPGEKWKVLEQISTFTLNPTATVELVDEHFAPGNFSTKSLKIGVGNDAFTPFYNQGQLENNDQTDAKYVKVYLRNDSGKDAGYGIFLTDVPQSTLDGTATTVDYGQEHWQLKWNAAVVLETLEGEKSVVVSTAGTGITIPKDFIGSVNIPIDSKTLALPGWYIAQGEAASNQVIDKDRIYCVSSIIPANNMGACFTVGEIWMKTDNFVEEILDEYYGEVAADAEKVIRPTTTDFTVDFENTTITFPYELTYGEFLEKFSIPSGYEVVVTDPDGFNVTNSDDKILDGCTAVFTDQETPFVFEIKVSTGTDSSKGSGCGSALGTSAALAGCAVLVAAAGCLLTEKRKRRGSSDDE